MVSVSTARQIALGRQGATFINLQKVKKAMLHDVVQTAWKTVAPVLLRKKYFPD